MVLADCKRFGWYKSIREFASNGVSVTTQTTLPDDSILEVSIDRLVGISYNEL
jgi:hypothetical protein